MFDLLKTPLYHYFGYQIFDLKIEPDRLETIASNLQVNLIYSILINACPKISYCNEENYYNNVRNSGCIILNQKQENLVCELIKYIQIMSKLNNQTWYQYVIKVEIKKCRSTNILKLKYYNKDITNMNKEFDCLTLKHIVYVIFCIN